MTVGLPGSGIGGLFYLISALAMPFHAIGKKLLSSTRFGTERDARPIRWAIIVRQMGMAAGIIIALWGTGWILAELLLAHPAALGQAQTRAMGQKLPNVLRAGAVIVSLTTLGIVLLSVQIARLVVVSNRVSSRDKVDRVAKIAAALLIFLAASPAKAQQVSSNVDAHLIAADQAFENEDTATARREYEAALAINPAATRAMYRLGQLSKNNPRKAESYFRMYVRDEPADAWGWIALGNSLSQQKKYSEAMQSFDRASALAPDAKEILQGRARIAAARARTAPAIELNSSGSRDSEENQSTRVGGALNLPLSDRASLRLSGGKQWLEGFFNATTAYGSVGFLARPTPQFRFEATGGVARPHSTISVTDTIPAPSTDAGTGTCTPTSGNGNGRGRRRGGTCTGAGTPPAGTIIQTESESAANLFVGSIRGVARKAGTRSLLDLRATRTLLDATPVLVINRVVRNEVAGRADVEVVRRLKLRGAARAGTYSATGDENTRTALLGGVAVNATDAIELSGVFQRLAFSHATTSGYFAPQSAQLAEAATYSEFEWPSGTLLILDAGAGAQRIMEFESTMSSWEPTYRIFASLDIPFRPASSIHLEFDSYDSRLGSDAPSTSSSWRSFALSASLRLALR